MKVLYFANNSGGTDWLQESDWARLAAAGWKVQWDEIPGTPAIEAIREELSLEEAQEEWAAITGQDPFEQGCRCCGPPHYFAVIEDEDEGNEDEL